MPIPQRVRDDAAEAERQMAQIQNGVQPTHPSPADEPPSDDGSPAPRDSDTQFGVGQQVTPVGTENNDNGSGPITAEAYAALQQRLNTLEGNFSRQKTELDQARGRNDVLETMLQRHVNERPAAPTQPAPPVTVAASVTDSEIDEYGADLTDFVRRLIKDALGGAITPLLDRIQQFEATLTETAGVARAGASAAASSVNDRYVQRMDSLVKDASGQPDWQAINTMHDRGDNRFVDWLNQTGEDSDEPRLNVIRRAFTARDADRCARMINNFKRDVGMADGTKAPPAPEETPAARAQALVSPSTTGTGSGAPRGRPAAKVYTEADVKQHYDEKIKGNKWKGKEAEWQRIADDMDKAVLDQRFTVEPRNQRGR